MGLHGGFISLVSWFGYWLCYLLRYIAMTNNCPFCSKKIEEHLEGRCLDRWIASYKYPNKLAWKDTRGNWWLKKESFGVAEDEIQVGSEPLPHYSTGMNHAIKLWKKLGFGEYVLLPHEFNEDGDYHENKKKISWHVLPSWALAGGYSPAVGEDTIAWSFDPALAICRAFIKEEGK